MPALDVGLMQICTGCESSKAGDAVDAANEVAKLFDLTTVNRLGMFLANVGHETGNLRFLTELWGPTQTQKGYDGREDLGNEYLGDGFKYRGRGWFQTTGRGNYLRVTEYLRTRFPDLQVPDFVAHPDLLATSQWAALAAGQYWDERELAKYADAGDFSGVCDMINLGHKAKREGASNGYADRLKLWKAARPALILNGWSLS